MSQPIGWRSSEKRECAFEEIIVNSAKANLHDLRCMGWTGIPDRFRALSWQLLLGYLPSVASRRSKILRRKRIEYQRNITRHYFEFDFSLSKQADRNKFDQNDLVTADMKLQKIRIDVDHMAGPGLEIFSDERVKGCLERILYLESAHSKSSQFSIGLSDLTMPLFLAFLSGYFMGKDMSRGVNMDEVSDEMLEEVEADVYWCYTKLLAAIHDRYSSDKPILHNMILLLEEVVHRVDPELHAHLKLYGVEFLWFSFKWMNCFLVREMNPSCALRLWDTCICEEDPKEFSWTRSKKKLCGFDSFYVYICAALLQRIREDILRRTNFEDILEFLQNLPTKTWNTEEIEVLMSQAFVWKSAFFGSERQLLRDARRNKDQHYSNKNKIRHWPPRKEMSRPDWSIETVSHMLYDAEGEILLTV